MTKPKERGLETHELHTFRLEPLMTISFETTSALPHAFPRFRLKSTDGKLDITLTPRDDLIRGVENLQLRFKNLPEDKHFDLERTEIDGSTETVFRGLSIDTIRDGKHALSDMVSTFSYTDPHGPHDDSDT